MRPYPTICCLLALISTGCGSSGSSAVEGKDYVVLERHRFLDSMRFDRPVEAFSMLFPKGWKIDGDVLWRGVQECRGDIVSNQVRASSADGTIRYEAMPSQTFSWADEPMLFQAMQAGARGGGCQLSQPFDAATYVKTFANRELKAEAIDIRPDESQAAAMKQLDDQANAISRQYANGTEQTTTMVFGKLKWPEGDEGILHVGVTNIIARKPDYFTGRVSTFSTTSVFYRVMMRYPAARAEDVSRLFGTIQASFRQNPVWQQAKDSFLTQLGNAEHAQRMETIRLMGEQSRAYAQARSEAMDQQMRDWENRQTSQDKQHKAFVQTIREVETWKDSSGTVELSSHYNQAWSRGDGTYILSNSPSFDPARDLQDQRWQEMKRPDR